MVAAVLEVTVKRANAANDAKQNWVSQYRDAYQFALPMRNLYETTQPGSDKMNRVFDSTAIISTQKFASRLQSNLTPPFQQWLDFLPGTDIPDRMRPGAIAKLQDVKKKFFGVIENSNFDTAITEFYLDLAVGTGVLLILEGDDENPVIFSAVPNAQVSLDEGPMGSVDGVFRQYNLAARNIEATWSDLLPGGKEAVDRLVKENGQNQDGAEANILEATYFDFKKKIFWYQVILRGSQPAMNISQPVNAQNLDKQTPTLLVERELKESPWIITRWMKVAGEVFGRGPILFALPDIKTLNKTIEFMLQNASMSINGLWETVNDSIANLDMVHLAAGTFFPVDKMGDIKRLDTPGNFEIGTGVAERMAGNIRQTLFDRGLPDPTGAVRSPTEIIERVRELAEDIGAPFSRIFSELLRPMATRVLNIMERKVIIDSPLKLNGKAVKLQATSPLAKQQSLNDLQSALQWLEILQSMGPEVVFGTVKVEDFAEWSGEKIGVDQKLIRSESERGQVQEMIVRAIAQAKTAQPAAA